MKLLLSSNIFLSLLVAGEPYKQGKLLESAGTYVCVETQSPDRILIGASRRPVKLATQPVLVKYDDESFWVKPAHHGTIRLRQDYLTRAFTPGSVCEQVVESAIARLTAPPKKLLVRGSSTQP
jgi:hypothetical protein